MKPPESNMVFFCTPYKKFDPYKIPYYHISKISVLFKQTWMIIYINIKGAYMFQIELTINEEDFDALLDAGAITETKEQYYSRFHLFNKIQVEIADDEVDYTKSFINFSVHEVDIEIVEKLKELEIVTDFSKSKSKMYVNHVDTDCYILTAHLFNHKICVFSKHFVMENGVRKTLKY